MGGNINYNYVLVAIFELICGKKYSSKKVEVLSQVTIRKRLALTWAPKEQILLLRCIGSRSNSLLWSFRQY